MSCDPVTEKLTVVKEVAPPPSFTWTTLTYQQRKILNELSKELFNRTGAWCKLMRKGTAGTRWHTYASIEVYMRNQLAQRQAKLDEMKKSQDEKTSKDSNNNG